MSENDNEMDINIDLNMPLDEENQVNRVDVRDPAADILQQMHTPQVRNIANAPPLRANAPSPNQNGTNNHLNAARLFHAMLVRVALKYSSKVPLKWRKVIEGAVLFLALILFFSLTFIHFNFTKTPIKCMDIMKPDWIRQGIVRIEIVQNLDVLEEKEHFINQYISERSARVCHFNPADVFRFGPSVIPTAMRNEQRSDEVTKSKISEPRPQAFITYLLSVIRPHLLSDEEPSNYQIERTIDEQEEIEFTDPLEAEAHLAYTEAMQDHDYADYKYVYRVEYAVLFGLLRLPPDYRELHNIPTTWVRIDAKSQCFGDKLSRLMMTFFVGYDEAVTSALRHQYSNMSWNYPDSYSMGYMHNILSHEHYSVVTTILGKSSYFIAALLMVIFTFAISMLLRFSHHQIFVFIIDLLHMFELQQPLNPPVAPLVTVVLALVGMEAIMAEVFNDTSIAFYVILIVWVADQYDAICCHSAISKKFWLRYFYLYQFFFYAYQYRFGGQYGGLALATASVFILHSMIYFFHHYEMPLILYQDRVSQVLADLHAPQ
uniref:Membralin n=1 Tax=Caenorhabditis japonica TaxID=281687 RepID=A0A8R1E2T1_CAEJA